MGKEQFGRLFKLSRGVVRWAIPRYEVEPLPETAEPVVYVSHHQNMKGPVTVLAWLDRPVRPWVFSAFMSQEDCFNQYVDYTFTERFGWPRALAKIVVWPISYYIAALMNSGRGIPVFRKSKKVMRTMKMSVEALQNGESLLIFPDVDYSDDAEEVGEIYKGFLFLEKYYHKKTGKHVAFVPLYSDSKKRVIRAGGVIRFSGERPFVEERDKVAADIHGELNRMAGMSEIEKQAVGSPPK